MGHGRAAVAPAVPGQGDPFHLAHQVRAHHHVCQLHARAARDGADVPFLLERDRLDRLGPAGVRAAVANRVGGLSRHGSWLAAAGGRGHSGVPPWADVRRGWANTPRVEISRTQLHVQLRVLWVACGPRPDSKHRARFFCVVRSGDTRYVFRVCRVIKTYLSVL